MLIRCLHSNSTSVRTKTLIAQGGTHRWQNRQCLQLNVKRFCWLLGGGLPSQGVTIMVMCCQHDDGMVFPESMLTLVMCCVVLWCMCAAGH